VAIVRLSDEGDFGDGSGRMVCPRCSGSYLHHGYVTVRQRDGGGSGEDCAGTEVTVDADDTKILRLGAEDARWSGRRDSVEIGFWCEECDEASVLELMQHKGLSLVRWIDPS